MKKENAIERFKFLDIARGIAICLVVIGHSGTPFRNFIYLFHIPLFFFISGSLFEDKHTRNIKRFIIKKITSLYFPFLFYEVLFLILHNMFYLFASLLAYLRFSEVNKFFAPYSVSVFVGKFTSILAFKNIDQSLEPLWFLSCLFLTHCLFISVSFVSDRFFSESRKYMLFILTSILFIIGMYLSHSQIHLPLYFEVALSSTLIYYLGYALKTKFVRMKFNFPFFILSGSILFVESFRGSIEMHTNSYSRPQFFLLSSLLGIYLVFSISKLVELRNLKFLIFIGKNSIPILALHFLSFKVVNMFQIIAYGYPVSKLAENIIIVDHNLWILYSIAGIALPILVVILSNGFKEMPIVKKYLKQLNSHWILKESQSV